MRHCLTSRPHEKLGCLKAFGPPDWVCLKGRREPVNEAKLKDQGHCARRDHAARRPLSACRIQGPMVPQGQEHSPEQQAQDAIAIMQNDRIAVVQRDHQVPGQEHREPGVVAQGDGCRGHGGQEKRAP